VSIDPAPAFALMWAGFAAWLGALAAAPRLGAGPVRAAIALGAAAFAAAPVILSHDVYSYVAYARLGVLHGLDPYAHPPLAAPTDPVFAQVMWTDATSAYGPLFTLATYPLAWVSVPTAVAALKVAAALSLAGIAALTARLAARRGIDPLRAAVFVGLNPLALVHVVGGAHNDGLAMLLAVAAVAALSAGLAASAGAALAAAVLTKLSTAFLVPFALLAAGRRPGGAVRLAAGAALAAGVVAAAAWPAFGADWLSGLGLAGENQSRTSHMAVPIAVARLTGLDAGPVRAAAAALYAALVAFLLLRTLRGGDWVRAAGWAAAGLLLATSWLLPWYLIWALPLAAVSRDRLLQALLVALTAYQLGARIPL